MINIHLQGDSGEVEAGLCNLLQAETLFGIHEEVTIYVSRLNKKHGCGRICLAPT